MILAIICISVTAAYAFTTPTPYQVLNIPTNANEQQIKKAYRTLAKKWHPDKNKNDPKAQQKFIELTKAYDALTSADKSAYADFEDSQSSQKQGFQQQQRQQQRHHQQYRQGGRQRHPFEDDEEVFVMNTPNGRFYFKSSSFSQQHHFHRGHDPHYRPSFSWLHFALELMFEFPYIFWSGLLIAVLLAYYAMSEIITYLFYSSSKPTSATASPSEQTPQQPPWITARGVISVLCAQDSLSVSSLRALRYKFRNDPVRFYSVTMSTKYTTTESQPRESVPILALSKAGKKWTCCSDSSNLEAWVESLVNGEVVWSIEDSTPCPFNFTP